ncbi:hypothetical protein K435DRAFT_965128 [Dendrothele bispora CBS 962.96]|uniref:Uncharacterized protein n=1 Tax=Dendrothele bispora (strain CBS 962.96) TaxID=1314807 RepID=A0A4S8M7G7_DENBC|nr:hypothetical protein K435DRAFT_965128 [Dendrothele bispora CBS 962.96]
MTSKEGIKAPRENDFRRHNICTKVVDLILGVYFMSQSKTLPTTRLPPILDTPKRAEHNMQKAAPKKTTDKNAKEGTKTVVTVPRHDERNSCGERSLKVAT